MADQKPEPEKPEPETTAPASRPPFAWLLLAGALVLLLVTLFQGGRAGREITPRAFLDHAREESFEGPVIVADQAMRGTLKPRATGEQKEDAEGEPVFARLSPQSKAFYIERLADTKQAYKESPGDTALWHIIIAFGPIVLIAGLLYLLFLRGMRSAGSGGMLGQFGRSRHRVSRKEHSSVRLADVAGVAEAKEEVNEIIAFLKDPKRFQRLGGRVPRGALLNGPPGCGKTLLAKAVAGEAEVPFFSISGSDFVEMFVGVGASRVRDLFKQAKESAPCIIFLDEIDAVGRRRGGGLSSGGHDEREQTLNAILVEMDGFESSDQVIVIAATNRQDVLDPALTRPGRFDRQIEVPFPDVAGRLEILKVHAERVKLASDVELETLARGTPMFSGADLAAIINEAAIAATLADKAAIEQADLEEARDKVRWGRARRSQRIEDEEKRTVAFHEAGHAAVMHFDPQAEPLHKVSIIPRGSAMGATFVLPEKDRHLATKRQLLAQLRVTFGGRIAEELFCEDVSSGAAQDIRQATRIARAMVTEYGMSPRLGFLEYGPGEASPAGWPGEAPHSEETARLIDEEVRALVDEAFAETRALLEAHAEETRRLAETLLRYETLTRDEVVRVFRGEAFEKPTVERLLEAEHARPPAGRSDAVPPASGDGAG